MIRFLPNLLLSVACLAISVQPLLAQQGQVKIQRPADTGVKKLQKKKLETRASLAMVVQTYRFLIDQAQDPAVRIAAKHRLADLNIELTEQFLVDSENEAAALMKRPDMLKAYDGIEIGYPLSIRLYREVLKEDPGYRLKGRVRYQLARALELYGLPAEMNKQLLVLVAEYPKHSNWTEARFRSGEYFFENKEYFKAETAYTDVLTRSKASAFHDKALYKHGWSLFKLGEYSRGLQRFFSLLELMPEQTPSANLSAADRQLMEDSYRVISLSFVYQDGAKAVARYFSEQGAKPYEPEVYRQLAATYLRQERYIDTAETYQEFMRTHRDHPESHRFQAGVVNAYTKGRYATRIRQAQEVFADTFNPSSKFWTENNVAIREEIKGYLEGYLPDLARYYHARAQSKKSTRDYASAAKWYRTYLTTFPRAAQSAEMNFLLAESLFESDQTLASVNEYEKTAYQYPNFDRRAEAGYAALVGYQKREASLAGDAKISWRQRAIQSGLRFAEHFFEDKRTAGVLMRVAEEQLALKLPGPALASAKRVLAMGPNREIQARAWVVQAFGAFDIQDYADAEKGFRQALRRTSSSNKHYPRYRSRLAASIYRQGERARRDGQLRIATSHFLRVAKSVPEAKIIVNARFDASTVLLELQDWPIAVKVLEEFRRDFKGHKLQKGMPEKLALAYEGNGQWSKAASELKNIARREGKNALAREALWRAAELYEKGDDLKLSVALYKRFVRGFPNPLEQSVEGRQRLVLLYKQTGQERKRQFWLRDIVKAHRKGGSQITERTRFLAASSAFELAEISGADFARIRLTLPLDKSLDRKRKAMQRSLKAYGDAAEFGAAEYTTASTFRIAEIYRQLGSDLLVSDRPKGLNEDELEQYDILLEEQAFPFEEKAIEVHEINVGRARGGLYDQWVKKTYGALAGLLPGRYAKREIGEEIYDELR